MLISHQQNDLAFSDAMHCIAPRNALHPPTQCIASAPASVCEERRLHLEIPSHCFSHSRMVFPVTTYSPNPHSCGNNKESEKLMGNTEETATTYEHCTYGINEVVHRIYVRGEISNIWHGTHRSKEPAEQEHTYHKEPHYEDHLLHGIAIIGDDKSETAPEECQQHSQGKDKP